MNLYRISKEVCTIDLEAGMIITITGYQPGYIPSNHGRRTIKEFPVSIRIREVFTYMQDPKIEVEILHEWVGWSGDEYSNGYTCMIGTDFFDSVIMKEGVV